MQTAQRRLRRVWGRTLAACVLYALIGLGVPLLMRSSGSRASARREEAPEYVMPNGERRRAVVFEPAARRAPVDRRGERALLWWSGILAAATIAGAVAQTIRIRADVKHEPG